MRSRCEEREREVKTLALALALALTLTLAAHQKAYPSCTTLAAHQKDSDARRERLITCPSASSSHAGIVGASHAAPRWVSEQLHSPVSALQLPCLSHPPGQLRAALGSTTARSSSLGAAEGSERSLSLSARLAACVRATSVLSDPTWPRTAPSVPSSAAAGSCWTLAPGATGARVLVVRMVVTCMGWRSSRPLLESSAASRTVSPTTRATREAQVVAMVRETQRDTQEARSWQSLATVAIRNVLAV